MNEQMSEQMNELLNFLINIIAVFHINLVHLMNNTNF